MKNNFARHSNNIQNGLCTKILIIIFNYYSFSSVDNHIGEYSSSISEIKLPRSKVSDLNQNLAVISQAFNLLGFNI